MHPLLLTYDEVCFAASGDNGFSYSIRGKIQPWVEKLQPIGFVPVEVYASAANLRYKYKTNI